MDSIKIFQKKLSVEKNGFVQSPWKKPEVTLKSPSAKLQLFDIWLTKQIDL